MSWNPTETLHSGFEAALTGVLDLLSRYRVDILHSIASPHS